MRKKAKPAQQKNKVKKELNQEGNRYLKFILPAILLLTVIAFSTSIGNGFTNWDDNKYIQDNPNINDFSWHGIKTIFTSEYFDLYIPVTLFSLMAEYHWFGAAPKSYHVINLLFHLLNTALVFYFIKILSQRIEAAIIVSLFFAIHPMHVESVAWIAERKDVLFAFFYLTALIAYVKYTERKKEGKRPASLWFYFFTLAMFVLSLLSKPTAITLPGLLLLLDYYYDRKLVSFKTILEKIPFFVLSVLVGLAIVTSSGKAQQIPPDYSFFDRIFLVTYAFAFYIVKLFLPFHLSAFYSYPVFKDNVSTLPAIYYWTVSVNSQPWQPCLQVT